MNKDEIKECLVVLLIVILFFVRIVVAQWLFSCFGFDFSFGETFAILIAISLVFDHDFTLVKKSKSFHCKQESNENSNKQQGGRNG